MLPVQARVGYTPELMHSSRREALAGAQHDAQRHRLAKLGNQVVKYLALRIGRTTRLEDGEQ